MVQQVYRIDSNGFLIEPVIIQDLSELTADLIEVLCPGGFYKPQFVNGAWQEGATADEISAIQASSASAPPTIEQRIDLMQSALDNLLMGGTTNG